MNMNRRTFLVSTAVVSGGFALSIDDAGAEANTPELSPWISIAPDDVITIRVPQPEIGNGAVTQIAMNIAEELNCNWKKVRTEPGTPLRNFQEKNVYNVGFLAFFGGHGTDDVRLKHQLQLGASARARLVAAAASRWKVAPADVHAADSVLTHKATGRKLRYGQVAAEAAKIKLPSEPTPKPHSEWRLLGKASPPKLHIPDITIGKAQYGIDVRVPGMLHAALIQSPVHGGKPKNFDPKTAPKPLGVHGYALIDPAESKGAPVKHESTFGFDDSRAQWGIAAIADHYWQAKTAIEALVIEWDTGVGSGWADESQIYDGARALLDKGPGKPLLKKGDVAEMAGTKIVSGEYGTPYCENAALEPLNATALVTADSAEVWAPTQDPQQAYWVAIDETGLPPDKVTLHPMLVGGGFGRRTQADDVRMAVAVARQFPGRPIKTIWSREEVFRQGRYRTPIITRYKAVLDEATGLPNAVTGDCAYVGTRPIFHLPFGYSDQPYFNSGIIPNLRLTASNLPINILNGAWRAPCYNSHCFNLETFVDECALTAGQDPFEYRLKLLAKWDKSWSDCLRVAAQKAGWGNPLPKGEGRGIAISCWPVASVHNFGSVIATVARVAVSPDGQLKVKQIDTAFDCGSVANSDAVRSQIEGGVLYGMSAALGEELTVKEGAIVEGNFDAYSVIRMADTPPCHVHFDALSGHHRMAIVGEAPVGPVQPAIGNAIFAATGKRLRRTPFIKQDLRWG